MSLKNPNPQGKGLVPVLDSLAASRTVIDVAPKHIEQISSELFTSLFVLHSRFHFKPIIGKSYWLYRRRDNSFHLSMIDPDEWGGFGFGQYIGECVLQQDITWTLELDTHAASDQELLSLIEEQRRQLETALHDARSIDDVLPVYLESLPFYQRVYASALANSLKTSMQKSGIQGLSYTQAKGFLTKE
ncbi:MAG: DUF2452 domain-containing protein [Gammaproteobacteria bacterium]|nr:DUF2452 domain-containing protein [Gammaproteobacteria bacterium]